MRCDSTGAPKEDLARALAAPVFNILISNTDDHLRNHGFLYGGRRDGDSRRPTISTPCRSTSSRASSRRLSTRMTARLRSLWLSTLPRYSRSTPAEPV